MAERKSLRTPIAAHLCYIHIPFHLAKNTATLSRMSETIIFEGIRFAHCFYYLPVDTGVSETNRAEYMESEVE